MANVDRDIRGYQWVAQVMSDFREGVRQAQEENRRLGVPIVYFRNGHTYYELPNGDIVRELPKEYEFPPLPKRSRNSGDVTSVPEA